ncbi:MAG TPA: aminotransferase class IV [Vicinamibacteria bacterium]|jgi:branched-chain amino acid aminotransferase|nr:aminotransferase class IV [Vicinamibacteria bacterium]
MVETFVLAEGAATPLRSAPDLATASGTLPAGAYTTLRTYGGDGVPFLDDHVRRLEESCALQGRPAALDGQELRAGLAAVLRATRHPESRIRVTFAPPELFASIEPFEPLPEDVYKDGVSCVTVPLRREQPQSKDTRFLSSAQGAYRALPPGVHEGLLLGEDGALLEGLSSNVFAVVDGVLRTEEARVLHGTTRGLVLELARGVVPISFEPIRKADLGRAAEMFLTSVSREVLGVVRVDEVRIGRGKPGSLARDLRKRYRARMKSVADHLLR